VVECDEVYIVAGHKGHPEIVRQLGRQGRRRRLKGARGRGTLAKEKPPVFGLIQRNGDLAIHMLPNVQQATIQPVITQDVQVGSLIYTDEYDIYARLHGMRTGMASTKSMSTRSKGSGRYSAPGYAPIAAYRKSVCRST
jgi:ISXO2-like transposase domain